MKHFSTKKEYVYFYIVIALFVIEQIIAMCLWFKAIFPPTFQFLVTIPLFVFFIIKKNKIFIIFASIGSFLISIPFTIFMLVMNMGIQSIEGALQVVTDVLSISIFVISTISFKNREIQESEESI